MVAMRSLNPFSSLLCMLGMHGPNVLGSQDQHRSMRTPDFTRTCGCCGKVWHGYATENGYVRYAVWSPVRNDGTSIDPR